MFLCQCFQYSSLSPEKRAKKPGHEGGRLVPAGKTNGSSENCRSKVCTLLLIAFLPSPSLLPAVVVPVVSSSSSLSAFRPKWPKEKGETFSSLPPLKTPCTQAPKSPANQKRSHHLVPLYLATCQTLLYLLWQE